MKKQFREGHILRVLREADAGAKTDDLCRRQITTLGLNPSSAFCGVWIGAKENRKNVEDARRKFDKLVMQV